MFTCNRCHEVKPVDAYHADASKVHRHATICKACVSRRQRAQRAVETPEKREARRVYIREYTRKTADKRKARYQAWRDEGLRRYGGQCACCGETEPTFLTFDHVGEWGAEHRASDSVAASIVIWLYRNNYPQDGSIRLLCWNCNCARGIYGRCPHEVVRHGR